MCHYYSIRRANTADGSAILGISSESSQAPEHIAEVVIDRMQVLRRRIDRSELDHEAISNHPVAERPFGRVGAIPREMNRLAVAQPHPRLLRGRERRRQVIDRVGLDHLPN